MDIVISHNVNKPIYEQITSQIKTGIMNGALQSGEALPSMRELAKQIQVSVITVQKAYEELQRDGFIETTVGRGSFVSAHNKEFYQEEQWRRAEAHLLSAAQIGRESNIALAKLTELLTVFYEEGERRIRMKEFLLRKEGQGSETTFSMAEACDNGTLYTLTKKQESMLAKTFVVQSKSGDEVADIRMEHILFTPAKLPKLTLTTKDGKRFTVKKEIEQLSDVIHVEGEELTVKGNLFSGQFELLCRDKRIAVFRYDDGGNSVCTDENYELLTVLFAFAIALIM